MLIMAGDIGGTSTRLICESITDNQRQIIAEKSYPSKNFTGLLEVVETFMTEFKLNRPIHSACFAIAGPVEAGQAKVTNLPWVITQAELAEVLQTPQVKLINDFVAVAYGVTQLQETDTVVLQQAAIENNNKSTNKDIAIIGAGTGLGASHLVWLFDHYKPLSSETGHSGFAPETPQQNQLLSWLQTTQSHVSLETVLSGSGLYRIYNFLLQTANMPESNTIQAEFKTTDPAQVITDYANNNDPLCVKALELFVEIYGAAAGNVVLSYYPVAELYIAGGIGAKLKPQMQQPQFINAFINKGLMTEVMKKVTVKLIMQEKTGLLGALSVARSF